MLSTWAFNALLKILEEPPEHLKFILATTEVHKIPETILSRTQRYDFKRITNNDIKSRLEFIAKEEQISVDEKSYDFIISNSWGALRNAISLFEQYILDSKIDYKNIISNLWLVSDNKKEEFYIKLINSDESIISEFESIIDSWVNIRLFIKDLIYYIKDKILEDLTVSNLNNNIFIIDTLQEAYIKSKNTFDEQLFFIITFVKIIKKYSPNVINNVLNTDNINSKEKIVVNNILEPKNKENSIKEEKTIKANISNDDIDDIFWNNSIKNNITKIKDSDSKSSNTNFNIETFISKVKEAGWKWWLTMSLRWSNISFTWLVLNINSTNAITKKNIKDAANNDIMFNALVNMWLENIEIIAN